MNMTFSREVHLPTLISISVHQNSSAFHCVVTLSNYHLLSKVGVYDVERGSIKDHKGKKTEFFTHQFLEEAQGSLKEAHQEVTTCTGRKIGTGARAHAFIRAQVWSTWGFPNAMLVNLNGKEQDFVMLPSSFI